MAGQLIVWWVDLEVSALMLEMIEVKHLPLLHLSVRVALESFMTSTFGPPLNSKNKESNLSVSLQQIAFKDLDYFWLRPKMVVSCQV